MKRALMDVVWDEEVRPAIVRLADISEENYYNTYQTFKWLDRLDESVPWMSEHLMTPYGTSAMGEFTRSSGWRSANSTRTRSMVFTGKSPNPSSTTSPSSAGFPSSS